MSSWKKPEVVRRYLDDVQSGIPYGTDQLHVMLVLIQHVRPHPKVVVDLGCGDGSWRVCCFSSSPRPTRP